jgi:hypothetical protein
MMRTNTPAELLRHARVGTCTLSAAHHAHPLHTHTHARCARLGVVQMFTQPAAQGAQLAAQYAGGRCNAGCVPVRVVSQPTATSTLCGTVPARLQPNTHAPAVTPMHAHARARDALCGACAQVS